ncbi:type III-B CRISPR module RAMP protein Cmr4 [Myxococcota bacterium]|nr:type III-B CRISPR module RAMP protein Cmr4 [Myxococcota bacterium]MBU1898656.1 type III-B CRISPR module RAMP protein Cmr4 [Myxococcota bacterium]
MNARLLFTHALSPLHAGTGQSVGAVDLAIARDRATGHPYIPGSSLKGSLRALAAARMSQDEVFRVFGPDTQNASEFAGALSFGDANLLLLPVRSIAGTFAWVTSPFLLMRYARDAREAGFKGLPAIPSIPQIEACIVSHNTALDVSGRVVFEDLDLKPAERHSPADEWASEIGFRIFDKTWLELFKKRICIVHDDVMVFLARHATDVVTRIRIDDEKKTVAKSQLWQEENLPVETILCSLLMASPHKKSSTVEEIYKVVEQVSEGSVQLGGKASVGRGRCRLVLAGG